MATNEDKPRQGKIPENVLRVRGTANMGPSRAPYLVEDGEHGGVDEAVNVAASFAKGAAPADGSQMEVNMADLIPEAPVQQAVGVDEIRKAMKILKKYKDGKKVLEDKIVRNEKWWKLRHWDLLKDENTFEDPKPASGWLFNCIANKHADFMDSYPASDILPREESDKAEAKKLSSIIPVIMEQNQYEQVYSDEVWYKLKNGTGVFGVFWDQGKLNGLGDISIRSLDLLNLFWEPGVTDIQKSQHFFSVELIDNEILEQNYPQLKGKLKATKDSLMKKYWYDENIDTTGKSAVIDWYYKKTVNGKQTLQYCKFVDETVLYATENDTQVPTRMEAQGVYDEFGNGMFDENGQPIVDLIEIPTGLSMAERGWYDHGMYPFVFDTLFPEQGMPVGFGFVDVCKNAQTSIDVLNNAFEKNALFTSSPRFFYRGDGAINEEEFANPYKLMVHTDQNLGADSLRAIETPVMVNSNYMALLDSKINEMKETAGNHDTTTGGTAPGVTAASAIAAMQEAAGKTSRDQIKTTFRAHEKVVYMVIELIRQFYDLPRQFRITGPMGQDEYVTYNNAGLQPQNQGMDFGVDMGYRLPVFDIRVEAERESSYSQLSQNELALQFYNNGFFNPQYADQVLACLDMMEFTGKPAVIEKVQQNGGMYQQMIQMQQQMLQMAEMIDRLTGSGMADQMAAGILSGEMEPPMPEAKAGAAEETGTGEIKTVANARERAASATVPR